MSAGCYRPLYNLEPSHDYSLIGAYELDGHKVLKMRNPWHSEKYTGPWSDKDKRWTPELRKQVGSVVENDGIFFFPAEDFMKAFRSIDIGYYDENWKQVTYKNTKGDNPGGKMTEIYLDNPVEQEVVI